MAHCGGTLYHISGKCIIEWLALIWKIVAFMKKVGVEIDRDIMGAIVFQIWPIMSHPDKELCMASQTLINEQLARFQQSHRILMQVDVLLD